jgi:hypothetical protein
LFILFPLTIFEKTRPFAGKSLVICSYIYGINLYALSFVMTLALWGLKGIVIGVSLFFIGIIPIALLATAFNSEWGRFLGLIVLIILTAVYNYLGYRVIKNVH